MTAISMNINPLSIFAFRSPLEASAGWTGHHYINCQTLALDEPGRGQLGQRSNVKRSDEVTSIAASQQVAEAEKDAHATWLMYVRIRTLT